ncbi:MAG TPA: iron chelate uptake ABC transporter family permease subunit [Armatimonadota bacterium]|nr:iron chelate uptake ABC transporter family permease subunit [Armatimonadota bacterium]
MTRERLRARAGSVLFVLALALLASAVISAGIGQVRIAPGDILRALGQWPFGDAPTDAITSIIWFERLPRIALALLAGGALAVAGVVMQALFHNPMADPYIVGVSSGAALGAVLAISLNLPLALFGFSPIVTFAFLGALGVTALVYGMAHRPGRVPITTLLLTGIAVGSLLQAVTAFLLLSQSHVELRVATSWLMGGLARGSWAEIGAVLPGTLAALALTLCWQRDLNALALGDDTAHHLGIHLGRTRALLLLLASLLAAGAVAVSGIIAFVGLIVPHLMRLIVGPNHRRLLPAALLGGGLLLLWADVLARTLLNGAELPIGIVTSILGAPFFLFLLHHRPKAS